ncbi:hypothetical protein GT347_02735 [Xylophilus rhododendri]|uniref:Uncharacterized protein n=1 Tax=Xylophilus rhododendri TaxID=2697032 RepID=A0A857IZV0_9BURK|nr:hypothetical protein [Xylophilus rhododendri]QHI96996.1 hypothetical protein GT347_02735 [Xylophilus rhododendri]
MLAENVAEARRPLAQNLEPAIMEFANSEAFWEDLPNQWRLANEKARSGRAAITAALVELAAGRGPGPTAEQLENCRRVERMADTLGEELAMWVERSFSR